jgi:hypothetical protein
MNLHSYIKRMIQYGRPCFVAVRATLRKYAVLKHAVFGCSSHSVRLKSRKYACGTYTLCERCTHTYVKLRTYLRRLGRMLAEHLSGMYLYKANSF